MAAPVRISRLRCGHAEQRWIDQHLADGLSAPALALIDYRQPCVIYGRRGGDTRLAQARAETLGYAVAQRRSGGGAVLAGPWMAGVNLLLPADHPLAQCSHVEAFRWFGECWRRALSELGVDLRLAEPAEFARHQSHVQEHALDWVCFAGISHGELLDAAGRKVLGLAQYRGRWGTLLSAGLLVGPTPWEQLEFIHTGQRLARSAMHELTAPVALPATAEARQQLQVLLLRHLPTTTKGNAHAS